MECRIYRLLDRSSKNLSENKLQVTNQIPEWCCVTTIILMRLGVLNLINCIFVREYPHCRLAGSLNFWLIEDMSTYSN